MFGFMVDILVAKKSDNTFVKGLCRSCEMNEIPIYTYDSLISELKLKNSNLEQFIIAKYQMIVDGIFGFSF